MQRRGRFSGAAVCTAPAFVLNLVFALSLVAAAGGGFVLGQMFQQMQMDARAYEAAQRV